jgi:hypothetical protein
MIKSAWLDESEDSISLSSITFESNARFPRIESHTQGGDCYATLQHNRNPNRSCFGEGWEANPENAWTNWLTINSDVRTERSRSRSMLWGFHWTNMQVAGPQMYALNDCRSPWRDSDWRIHRADFEMIQQCRSTRKSKMNVNKCFHFDFHNWSLEDVHTHKHTETRHSKSGITIPWNRHAMTWICIYNCVLLPKIHEWYQRAVGNIPTLDHRFWEGRSGMTTEHSLSFTLSAKGIANIPWNNYENDFTF